MYSRAFNVPFEELGAALAKFGLKPVPGEGSCSYCIVGRENCSFRRELCVVVLDDNYIEYLDDKVEVDWDELKTVLEGIKALYELQS